MTDNDWDENEHESEDDALEETRAGGMFHPDTDEEKLPGDYDPPFTPARQDEDGDAIDEPDADDRPDEDEVYSEGLAEAISEADEDEEDSDDAPPRALEPEDDEE